ncbi:MAG: hypothetical protein V4505_02245 [Pseudomonadota bacterium]
MRLRPAFPLRRLALLALGAAAVAACTPALNWREFSMPPSRLLALMPCKPDEAMRSVQLDGRAVDMHLAGCDAGGATFVVGWLAVAPPGQVGPLLGAWQDATLTQAGIAAGPDAPAGRAFVPPGALAVPQSVRLAAQGRHPDGKPLALQAAWFAAGGGTTPQALFAAVYGDLPAGGDAADTFFAGLRLQ